MNSVPAWLLVLTGLGGGAIGAIITTYGTQTHERRQARAAAREALRSTEDLGYRQPEYQVIKAELAKLEISAMLAGLPRKLTELHAEARMRHWELAEPANAPQADRNTEGVASGRVAYETAQLLSHATWHPWATAPRRWYRTRLLDAGMPEQARRDQDRRRGFRKWERDTIRAAKTRNNGEKASSARS